MTDSVSENECRANRESCRKEVIERLSCTMSRKTFFSILGLLCALVVGCYGFVWAANGRVLTVLDELKADMTKVKVDVAVTKTIVRSNNSNTKAELKRINSTLETQEVQLDKVRESLARIEKNGHE